MSGIGKGVTTASIGKLFQFRDYTVDAIKIDPYLNVDPGTLNPIEHGEVFVTEEVWEFEPVKGMKFRISEIDQDFGTYERFLGKNIHPRNNITSGQVYLSVILKERAGEFLGKTVQIIPHITDEIKRRIRQVAEEEQPDILMVEVGGTVGDIEAMPYLEAIRQFRLEEPRWATALVHVTVVPRLKTVGEHKTKPTQHSVKLLQGMGLQPDVIVCRSDTFLSDNIKRKISLFCNVPPEAVISNPDLECVYELPLIFERQGLGDYLCKLLNLEPRKPYTEKWKKVVSRFKNARRKVRIALPGKYTAIHDSYISINEALSHAAAYLDAKVEISWLDSEKFEKDKKSMETLSEYDGILLTPGFGSRGVEGMILSAIYAMKNDVPFLGICFGAQLFFVAFCREYLGLEGANSTEVDPNTKFPVVDLLPEQKRITAKGGTMRLGGHEVIIEEGTRLYDAYKRRVVIERFRHRYHIIREFAKRGEEYGLVISAYDKTGRIINAIELEDAKWMVGVQFHPEFKSRPDAPSPIYLAFVKECLEYRSKR